jgi:hypothetical protein
VLKATFREFCNVSGAWVRKLDPIDAVKDKEIYCLDPQPDASILYILSIVANPDTPWHVRYYGDPEIPGRFKLLSPATQDITDGLIPYVALTLPEQWSDRVPYTFKRYHFDTILDGAAGRLFAQPGKPYTSMPMAKYHLRRFRSGMAAARDMARRQFTASDTDFAFPKWAV